MSVGVFIFLLSLIGMAILGASSWLSARPTRDFRRELRSVSKREALATKTLRKIANGSGNPELEAQIALDELNNLYDSNALER